MPSPTNIPSSIPTKLPTTTPSNMPSLSPSHIPSNMPSQLCEPTASLHGISVYSATNLNLNRIVCHQRCRYTYRISWNVFVNKVYENDLIPIDLEKSNHLQMHLSESGSVDSLSIDANNSI